MPDPTEAAGVRLGNIYYHFKTKDDLVAAVVQARVDELEAAFAALERGHDVPKARLKALVGIVAGQGASMARFGCPCGSLCSELAGRLVLVLLGWVERQLYDMGRHDARELAVEFVAAYQGTAAVTATLGDAELMVRQGRRLENWIDALAPATEGSGRPFEEEKGSSHD